MAKSYRVVDRRAHVPNGVDMLVDNARTPEEAAEKVLGLKLVRSGAPKDLACQVYYQRNSDPVSMVRLYFLTER